MGSGGMLTSPLARIHSPRRIPNPPRAVRMTFYLLSCHQRGRRAPRQAPRSPARPRSSQRPLPVPPSVSPPPPAPSEQEHLGEEEPRTVSPSGQGPCRRHPSDPATPVQAAEPLRCVSSSYAPTRHPAPAGSGLPYLPGPSETGCTWTRRSSRPSSGPVDWAAGS